MPSEIEALARTTIREKVFPGCVVGIVRRDGTREILPFGNFTYDADSPTVREDTVYDLASVTKSIPVASLALAFVSEGKLSPADPVKKYLPELKNDRDATIEDLLRYRVHGVQLSKLRHATFEEIRTHVLEHGFDGPPGESIYTNLPAYVLGVILERVGGSSLAVLAHRYFFEPLHMEHTTFFPSVSDCAPSEIDGRGEVQGMPHDESAYIFAKRRRTVGHAGLFSAASDILDFLEALLAGTYPFVTEGAQQGLGWQLSDARFMGGHAGLKTFGKTGFTGTSVVCDIERGIAFVILSNRTYPKRPPDDTAIYAFRAGIADIILR